MTELAASHLFHYTTREARHAILASARPRLLPLSWHPQGGSVLYLSPLRFTAGRAAVDPLGLDPRRSYVWRFDIGAVEISDLHPPLDEAPEPAFRFRDPVTGAILSYGGGDQRWTPSPVPVAREMTHRLRKPY